MGKEQVEKVRHLRDVSYGRKPSRLRLLAPLRYLAIRNKEKSRYDIYYPLACGFGAWILFWTFTPHLPLFGEGGLLRYTRDFLMMSVPFMVGGLAVVATGLPGDHFDERLRGVTLHLDGKPLTLRRFVCYLLGYLSFLGLLTLIGVVAASLLRDNVVAWAQTLVQLAILKLAGTLLLSILLSALVITVFWSLYFLTDVVNNIDD